MRIRVILAMMAALLAALALASPAVANATPPHRQVYTNPRIPSPKPSGHLRLHFNNEFTSETIGRVYSEVLPYLYKVFGRPWQDVNVDLRGPADPPPFGDAGYNVPFCYNRKTALNVIHVLRPDDLTLLAAELQHSLHGCYMFEDQRFEESPTEAAERAVGMRFGLAQFPCEPSECNNLRLPGSDNPKLAGGELFIHDTSAPLADVRQRLGGMAWLQYEQAHPGFTARFNAAMCEEVFAIQKAEGGRVHTVQRGNTQTTTVANALPVAESVDSDFGHWFRQQVVFRPRHHGDDLIIVPRQGRVQFIAVHRTKGDHEFAISNLPVTYTIHAPNYDSTGVIQTDPVGQAGVDLPTDARGLVTVSATAPGGLHDQFSYYNIYFGS